MAIDDLHKRIFSKEGHFEKRYKEPELTRHKDQVPGSWRPPEPEDKQETEEVVRDKKLTSRILWWGIGGGVGVLMVVFGFLLIQSGLLSGTSSGSTTLDKVSVEVEGGSSVTAGKKVTWKVTYKNGNSIPLTNAILHFQYPPGTQPLVGEFSKIGLPRTERDVGTIPPGSVREELFEGLVFGPRGASLNGVASLEYRPQDSSVTLEKKTDFQTAIQGTLLGVDIEVPSGLQAGQEADVKVRVSSSAESTFRGLSLGLTYPFGFEYMSATPAPESGTNTWTIGDLPAGGEYTITIHGKVRKTESAETIHAQVGLYDRVQDSWIAFNSADTSFNVSSSLLSVSLATTGGEVSSGIVRSGAELTVSVRWANNLPVTVKNPLVEVALDGDAFDIRSIRSQQGEFDASGNKLRWVPGRIPELSVVQPGDGGTFTFSVAIKPGLAQNEFTNHTYSAKLHARIDATEIPPGFNGVDVSGKSDIEYLVTTKPGFTQKGYYFDTRVQNTGPLPPRVGQETTYLIVWSVVNTLNDLENVTVRATLPSYVKWKGVVVPSGEKVDYKPSTGELSWVPGKVSAGVGYREPAKEVAFQVGLTPSLPQIDSAPQLISAASFEAQDSLTHEVFNRTGQQVTTAIPDDQQGSRLTSGVK